MQNTTGSNFGELLANLKQSIENRRANGSMPTTTQVVDFASAEEICPEHGAWKRYVRTADRGLVARPCCPGCARQAGLKQASVHDSIPERFVDASFENYKAETFEQKIVLKNFKDYAKEFDSGIPHSGAILWGDPGTGKSHLAVSLLRYAVGHGRSAYYTTAWALLDRLHRSKMFNAEREEMNVIDRLAQVDLLVIEDIGKSATTEREAAQYYALLDARWAACKCTVITTNEPPEVLRSLLTPAGYERLAEGARVIHLDWPSRRRIGAEQPERPIPASIPPEESAWNAL
jgi:DNA replication protein DnaC